MHSVTDRQADRHTQERRRDGRQDDANSRSYWVAVYDRLKMKSVEGEVGRWRGFAHSTIHRAGAHIISVCNYSDVLHDTVASTAEASVAGVVVTCCQNLLVWQRHNTRLQCDDVPAWNWKVRFEWMTCQRTEQPPQPPNRLPHQGFQVPSPTFRSHVVAGGDAGDEGWTSAGVVDNDEVTPAGDWPAGAMTSHDAAARRHHIAARTTQNSTASWHRWPAAHRTAAPAGIGDATTENRVRFSVWTRQRHGCCCRRRRYSLTAQHQPGWLTRGSCTWHTLYTRNEWRNSPSVTWHNRYLWPI